MTEQIQNGIKVSELERVCEIDETDLFLFSNEHISSDQSKSNCIEYGSVVSILLDEINAGHRFGTMITESESEYSKIDHIHDYSRAYAQSFFELSDSNQTSNLLGVIKTETDGLAQEISVWLPDYRSTKDYNTRVGDILMVGTKQKEKEEIEDSISKGTFDGWVYADGSRYGKTQGVYDFTEAYTKMAKVDDSTFEVPLLSDFLKANSSALENATGFVSHNETIPNHVHLISSYMQLPISSVQGKIDAAVKIPSSRSIPQQNKFGRIYAKNGDENENTSAEISSSASFEFTVHISSSFETQDFDDGVEYPHPKYVNAVPMIYIGRKLVK